MSYTAQNLDEIAAMFEHYAKEAVKASASLGSVSKRLFDSGEAHAWTQAAYILRRVTLMGPGHTEINHDL